MVVEGEYVEARLGRVNHIDVDDEHLPHPVNKLSAGCADELPLFIHLCRNMPAGRAFLRIDYKGLIFGRLESKACSVEQNLNGIGADVEGLYGIVGEGPRGVIE